MLFSLFRVDQEVGIFRLRTDFNAFTWFIGDEFPGGWGWSEIIARLVLKKSGFFFFFWLGGLVFGSSIYAYAISPLPVFFFFFGLDPPLNYFYTQHHVFPDQIQRSNLFEPSSCPVVVRFIRKDLITLKHFCFAIGVLLFSFRELSIHLTTAYKDIFGFVFYFNRPMRVNSSWHVFFDIIVVTRH